MNRTDFRIAYDCLLQIYRDNAYFHIVMKENTNKRVRKIVAGVIEKHYELNYILNTLTEGRVKNNVRPIVLIGLYSWKYLKTPQNVIFAEIGDTLESLGKGALKQFVFAVLRKAERGEYSLPTKSDKNYLEVKYNLPSWLVGMYRKDYPDTFEQIINATEFPYVHVRKKIGIDDSEIFAADKEASKTPYGFFVRNGKEIELLSCMGKITYMSYASCIVADSVGARAGMKILDCCAAPGGKAVALAQNGASVTACDLHEHRVELVRAYAERMKTGLEVYRQDATQCVHKWIGTFDAVLADVPCSGFGVVGKKRDIVLNRTYEDVKKLSELQLAILNNVSQYVKSGGVLVYSTCTVFKMENGANIEKFLSEHRDFHKEKIEIPYENNGEIQLLPDGKGMEGFYICRMRKD